jgi:hypothetical protein
MQSIPDKKVRAGLMVGRSSVRVKETRPGEPGLAGDTHGLRISGASSFSCGKRLND